jgi:MFS transporter, NNP family, nitrate/nitrite transporter
VGLNGCEIGALGGGFLPNAMGQSKQLAGTYLWGFVSFAVLAIAMLLMLRVVQIRWTRTWAEKGGRARSAVPPAESNFARPELSPRGVRP